MMRRLLPVLALLPLASAQAQAQAQAQDVLAACPATWESAGVTRLLRWAEVWAGYGDLPMAQAQVHEWAGGAQARWHLDPATARPLYLFCRYGKDGGAELAVSIPNGAQSCKITWKAEGWDAERKVNADYGRTLRAECVGSGEKGQVFASQRLNAQTDLEGLNLRKSAARLQQIVQDRGGQWRQSGQTAFVLMGQQSLTITFSKETGLARDIVLSGDAGLYDSAIRRFGFPQTGRGDCSQIWWDKTDIQLEWRGACGQDPQKAKPELRLSDTAAAEFLSERRQ